MKATEFLELQEAIGETLSKAQQSEQFGEQLRQLISNSFEGNLGDNDVRSILEIVTAAKDRNAD